MLSSSAGAKRINELQAGKIFLVVGHDHAIIAPRPSPLRSCRARFVAVPLAEPSAISLAQIRPAFSSNGSTRPANRACGPSGPANQASNNVRFFPSGFSSNPRWISRDRQRGDEQVGVNLFRHPREKRRRWAGLCDIADDVGVEEIASHSSTLRPASRDRVRSRSASTSGERRNAARIPPLLGGSPAMVWLTAFRMRAASGSSSASRFASERIRSRSASRPSTSNRAMPRLTSRVR